MYHGLPYKHHMQTIPGRIECELYDEGGEGIAYHDTDSVNNGSGKLNPANGDYLNEFRMKEGVDISYTKGRGIDDNPFNKTPRTMQQLYVGWTQPGEWINYTIKAQQTGFYRLSLLYTANGNGAVSFDIDGKPATGALVVASVHDDRDTVAWRQWHHWNRNDSLAGIYITKGVHLLTLHVAAHGNMNFDWLEFNP